MIPAKFGSHLAKRFQRRRFLKTQPIRIKNYQWRPCFLSDRDEMNNLYKGPPIDASCKVWFHFDKQFWPIRIKIWPMVGCPEEKIFQKLGSANQN